MRKLRVSDGFSRVRRLPIHVSVHFARQAGVLETLEGPVGYEPGAALLSSPLGDRWPVERAHFDTDYFPVDPAVQPGHDGTYQRREAVVSARKLNEPTTVAAGSAGDRITGQPGDWLVKYGPERFGIVAAAVFARTYAVLAEPEA
jgi:hypothetical protein